MRGICYLDIIIDLEKYLYDMGDIRGVVPEAFTILRQLLDRLNDPLTGEVKVDDLQVKCPEYIEEEAEYLADISQIDMYDKYKAAFKNKNNVSKEDLK